MNQDLKVSDAGLEFITNEEGVVLHVYLDQVGLETIGVGHLLTADDKTTGKFKSGITRDQAIALLKKDVLATENTIKKYITVLLNQNQFDALASMLFNTGPSPVVTGTLGKLINAENFTAVPDEMAKWCHAGNKVLPALQARRRREGTLFTKPVEVKAPEPILPVTEPIVPVVQDVPKPEPIVPVPNPPVRLTFWQELMNLFK